MTEETSKGITAAQGFIASGIHCGVKKAKKDLALIYSTASSIGAAVFTQNKVPAAPVIVDKKILQHSSGIRAIVINSGNANACTGERGLNDAWRMIRHTADALEIQDHEVLVSSTGIIGQYLPIEKIETGVHIALQSLDKGGHIAAAEAIMTTDTFVKECAVKISIDNQIVTIGGMAKGSGMIAPNMATMLAFISTDASITSGLLHLALQRAVDQSFNRISVDGDTSTNDMVAILANGLAQNKKIDAESDPDYRIFYQALEYVLVKLSKMIVLDGEGASKLIEIKVTGACTEECAVQAARAIANSSLVKTAIHGEDANWGRILAAVGYSGIEFIPEDVEIFFDDVPILQKNYLISFCEADAKRILQQKAYTITVGLNQGDRNASFWTCDLSKKYIDINANYRT